MASFYSETHGITLQNNALEWDRREKSPPFFLQLYACVENMKEIEKKTTSVQPNGLVIMLYQDDGYPDLFHTHD